MDSFIMPSKTKNEKNEIRRVGFELEFANVEIKDILQMLQKSFGFEVHKKNNFLYKLGSKYGDFTLELDFELLTKQKTRSSFQKNFQQLGISIDEKSWDEIEEFIGSLSKNIVPYEISTPPLPLNEMEIVEEIVQKLNQSEAHGTKEKLQYAFGLHINVEAVSLEVESLLAYLRAYLILQDFIKKDSEVDITRSITPFINDFKSDYIAHTLDEKYKPAMSEFIDDYIQYNPTRNRSLDMLPILAFIDKKRVVSKLPAEKIKPRPAFHYRLSNSKIGDSSWRVAHEWNRWILVEKLANDRTFLDFLSKEYLKHLNNFINLKSWNTKVKEWIKSR